MLALLRHQVLLLLALSNLILVVHSAATCYLPDGSKANKDDTVYQPCNVTAADKGEGSACCELKDGNESSICLTTGLCFGSDSYVYRGGCTDSTWNSPNCAKQCLDTKPDRYSNLYPCGSNGEAGTYTQNFCCGGLRGSSDSSCCDDSFSMRNGLGFAYVQPSIANDTAINNPSDVALPAAATTVPQAAPPSPTPSPPSSNTTAVAAGVAVPLGVLLIAAVALLLYREQKRKKMIDELVAQKTQLLSNSSGAAAGTDTGFQEVKGYYGQESPLELSTEGRGGRAELASALGPFHEVGIMSPR